MEQSQIRNFCIIAHIDHGKSTLADRFLELTHALDLREMQEQVLDHMELERERGITIKAKAVRMSYTAGEGEEYILNLVDTPGHVDFSYEVSRSLAACEGAILVVDASQGIQAQTLANTHAALEHNLALIPVVNKIDLPNAEPERVARELEVVLGFSAREILFASAKEGKGIKEVLEAVIHHIPPPSGSPQSPLRALIFDSKYDPYKGVIAYIRVMDGKVVKGMRLLLMSTGKLLEAMELGVFTPWATSITDLGAGEIGYIATGLKNVTECPVGGTVTGQEDPAEQPLPGYRSTKPMVFASLYPVEGTDYNSLRDALDKLKLNDASLVYEPESSVALGFGFRCGFLGLLHMDIVKERLEREYGVKLLITAPSVAYQVTKIDSGETIIDNPSALPSPNEIREIREPWINLSIITPARHIGPIMDLLTEHKGEYAGIEYLRENTRDAQGNGGKALLQYNMPLRKMLTDFYDDLKSRSQGYASLDYTFSGYRAASLVKLDVLVNGQVVDALSLIVSAEEAYQQGKTLIGKLRGLIPRQLFEVSLQAAVGKRVIARETIKPLRKNVVAKCYGGDVTRKRKLLEKQTKGKKRLKKIGQVEIPQEAFMAVLKLSK